MLRDSTGGMAAISLGGGRRKDAELGLKSPLQTIPLCISCPLKREGSSLLPAVLSLGSSTIRGLSSSIKLLRSLIFVTMKKLSKFLLTGRRFNSGIGGN